MKRIDYKFGKLSGLVAGLLFAGLQANAVPITGEIHFVGLFTPMDENGVTSSLGDAAGIAFSSPTLVSAVSGVYWDAGVTAIADVATMQDFFFEPSLSPDPVILWSVDNGGFSFELNDIAVNYRDETKLDLSGTGILRGTGYEDTPGTWSFQGGGTALFTFRADSGGSDLSGGGGHTAIPDSGATIGLLAIAMSILFVSAAKPLAKKKS